MISSDAIRGVLVLLLIFATDLNSIYLIFFALSAVSSFFVPAQSVALRTVTPSAGLLPANALMAQAIQGMQIISPALAGVLVQWLGASSCFVFDSFSFFFSAGMVMTLLIDRERASGATGATTVLSSMRQSIGFIFSHSVVSFVIVSMTAGMFAIRCFGALLSVYVRDILASNAAMFGTLNSLIGIGMIIGSQSLRRLAMKISEQHLIVYGLGGMGIAILVTAIFGRVSTTAVGMLTMGFFAAFIMITAQTVMQKETPQEMLGRVSSTLMSLLAFSQVIAMFVAGPVAQKAGIRNLYFGSAVLLVGIALTGNATLRGKKPHAASDAAGTAAEA